MTTSLIHPSAIIDPKAQLGEGVEIGPNAIIEAGVSIGDRTKIGPLVHIQGTTEIGPDNVIYTGVTLGFPPQYLGFSGAPTRLKIGARNTIREYANIHRALNDQSITTVGDDNFIMGFSHIAHDCHIGNRVIIANGALLAGHVTVGDRAFVSGNVAVHQFCRIGRLTMVGGLARITRDAPPFMIVEGFHPRVRGLNVVGLRRADVPSHVRMELKRLLRTLYRPGVTIARALQELSPIDWGDEARELIEFYKTSKRGFVPFGRNRGESSEEEDGD